MSHRIPTPTRVDVLGAITLCDHLGVDRFLAAYGYKPATKYVLRYAGRAYPSKAILGVASNMNAREFSGGAAHTARVLGRLGFTVREGRPRGLDPLLAALAREAAIGSAWHPPAAPELPVEPVAFFASGSNHAGEIRALGDMGHDVGVAVKKLNVEACRELRALAGTDVQVFVDSGAFSEVVFEADGPRVVRPMPTDEWREIVAIYKVLGEDLGDQLHVVAPDRVGCQVTTMSRLSMFVDELRELHAMGVRVLLPVQRGDLTQAEFYRRACKLLGFNPVPALPCRKAATSVFEAYDFCREVKPPTVHLMGIGTRSTDAGAFLEACRNGRADVLVQLDAVIIRQMVGRTNGPKKGPRRLTVATDLCLALGGTAARKYAALVLAMGGLGIF